MISEGIMKSIQECRNCAHLTNVTDEERPNDNVMGGCFIDGHITFTDCKGCKHWEKWCKQDNL